MAEDNDEAFKRVSDVLGKAELRSSFTTLTYISDDDTPPNSVRPDFKENDGPDRTTMDNFEFSNREIDGNPPAINSTYTGETSTDDPIIASPSENIPTPSLSFPVIPEETTEPYQKRDEVQNGVKLNGNHSKYSTNTTNSVINNNNTEQNVQQPNLDMMQFETTTVPRDTPLRKRKILLLKVFSIVATIFFFPTGIPAIYYAFKIEKAFNEGIMQGNIDVALKLARKTEKFIILSVCLGVLLVVMVFAIVERVVYGYEFTWQSRTITGG